MDMPPTHRKSPTTLKSTPFADPAVQLPDAAPEAAAHAAPAATRAPPPLEIGGVTGPDPTRFGDWEKNGRCIDF
jgi:hypothetical protein